MLSGMWKLARESSTTSSWGHWAIAAIEFLPVVGALAALVERIVTFICKLFEPFLFAQPAYPIQPVAQPAQPVYSLIPEVFQIVSACLPSDEALALNNLFPGMFFGERTSLSVSYQSIDALEREILVRRKYGTEKIESLIFTNGLLPERIINFLHNFSHIKYLDFSGCVHLFSANLGLIAEHCSQLRSLKVGLCLRLTDAALISIAEHCPGLQSLVASECSELTNTAFISIAAHCRQLQSLDISACIKLTDTALALIAAYCPQLQSLTLSDYYEELIKRAFGDLNAMISKFPNLQRFGTYNPYHRTTVWKLLKQRSTLQIPPILDT